MNIAEFRAHRRSVTTEHGEISFVDVGEGPPALFLHGVFLNAFLWRPAITQLAGERRCLAVELPAHGETHLNPGRDMSLPTQAEVVHGLCRALELERVDLVANDTGGAVAQVIAARWPELVRTLTLTNCDAHDNLPPEAFHEARDAAARGDLAPLVKAISTDLDLARGDQGGFGVGFEHPDRLTDEELAEFVNRFATDEGAREVERFVNDLDASDLLAIEPRLNDLRAPTLIVWGTGDVFFERSWAFWLRDTIAGAEEVVEVHGGKLFFPYERAEELVPHLRRHWAQNATESDPCGEVAGATERDAQAMLENFKRLWDEMDPEIVEDIVAPDATAFWSSAGEFNGSDYPAQMRQTMNAVSDAKMEVTGHAIELPYLFISWILRGTLAGAALELHGIDRFRLRGRLADDVWAIFDTGPMREQLARAERST
jgi:pimeloyl-ACP methyl ester carboxylesterase